MAAIFKSFDAICFRNDLHVFKINSEDILYHFSSIAVLNETVFGWEVAFVLFSKTRYLA